MACQKNVKLNLILTLTLRRKHTNEEGFERDLSYGSERERETRGRGSGRGTNEVGRFLAAGCRK
jgi:hypothetical protein